MSDTTTCQCEGVRSFFDLLCDNCGLPAAKGAPLRASDPSPGCGVIALHAPVTTPTDARPGETTCVCGNIVGSHDRMIGYCRAHKLYRNRCGCRGFRPKPAPLTDARPGETTIQEESLWACFACGRAQRMAHPSYLSDADVESLARHQHTERQRTRRGRVRRNVCAFKSENVRVTRHVEGTRLVGFEVPS